MIKNKINYKLVNVLLILLIVAVLYWISGLWIGIFKKVLAIVFPFLVGFAIAYALYPLKKKRASQIVQSSPPANLHAYI